MVKRFINRIPFRTAMALCIGLFLLLGVVCSAILIRLLDNIWVNLDVGKQAVRDGSAGVLTIMYDYSPWVDTMNSIEGIVIPFVFCSIGAFGGAAVFYRWRMKKPLRELFQGVKKVRDQDLDFHLTYSAPDELGALCESFETMRSRLDANFKELWTAQEERKRLNAAFAHDIRTPLTILKGQSDMLKRNIESGRIDIQKAVSSLSFIEESISRFERYINEMTSLQRLEEIEPERSYIKMDEYSKEISGSFSAFSGQHKAVEIKTGQPGAILYIDRKMAARVIENLVSNGLRYAKSRVVVELDMEDKVLSVMVKDDGDGFSADALKHGLEPFYRCDGQDRGNHLGLGLNICRTLTEKHGGSIELGNLECGGGQVTAKFSMKE
jgi:His Kinase A (phosphoacceptor) domain./Histidine kinase-, DNA gyrase B-, and HSP90-like ATPase./HAMP domain.